MTVSRPPAPLYLLDDAQARKAEPFALTRPFGELRIGAWLGRERWERATGLPATAHLSAPHLTSFSEFVAPPVAAADAIIPAGALIANARFAPADARLTGEPATWVADGVVAAVRLARPLAVHEVATGSVSLAELASGDALPIEGWWMERPWDLVRHLPAMLGHDLAAIAASQESAPHAATIIGSHPVIVEPGATVEPMVLFDASAGPIVIRAGASVAAFTRLVGPCFIGAHAMVLGGKVATSSVGEQCRVHGEVSTTIFVGHANKGHDGFVGHSVIGRWCNLGAGTTTSNLKNTYGTVRAWAPDGDQATGMQFLGTLMGDHARTAIGTRLNTGTVAGTGANILAAGLTPKMIPPFAFGDGTWGLDKFLEVAGRVMARRGISLGDAARSALSAAFAARWGGR